MSAKPKMKTMMLSQLSNPNYVPKHIDPNNNEPQWRYLVEEVKNATAPGVHDTLSKAEVDAYCDQDDWTVVIRKAR